MMSVSFSWFGNLAFFSAKKVLVVLILQPHLLVDYRLLYSLMYSVTLKTFFLLCTLCAVTDFLVCMSGTGQMKNTLRMYFICYFLHKRSVCSKIHMINKIKWNLY